MIRSGIGAVVLCLLLTTAAAAAGFEACPAIEDDASRLRCYDEAAGRVKAVPAGPIAATQPAAAPQNEPLSYLSRKWQLDPESKRRRFAIMPHRENYILPYSYNFTMDKQPYEQANPGTELQDAEAKFQLSIKVKLMEDILGFPLDLWFGYTQLSFWQVYNTSNSSPFRETNYEPEFLLNYHTDTDLFGMTSRFIQVGLNHQSNGQGEPLSRSWNRVVANFGLERKDTWLILKTWLRIPESAQDDDNPDILSYLGYGELWAGGRFGRYTVDTMFRNNLRFDDNRFAFQLGVSGPLIEYLNWYVQYFAGYGESLIDYNHYTSRIGVGFLVKDW